MVNYQRKREFGKSVNVKDSGKKSQRQKKQKKECAQKKLKQTRLSGLKRRQSKEESDLKRRKVDSEDEPDSSPAENPKKAKKHVKRRRQGGPRKNLKPDDNNHLESGGLKRKRKLEDPEAFDEQLSVVHINQIEKALIIPEVKKVGRPRKCALEHIYSQQEEFLTIHHAVIMETSRNICNIRSNEKKRYYPDPDYMARQDPKIFSCERRLKFIKVIGEIISTIEARKHTFHLAVRLLDRYASKVKLSKEFVYILPFAVFSIASKYIERKCYSMGTYSQNFNEVRDKKYVIAMERHILEMVDFQIDDVLPLAFAERFFLFAACELKRYLKRKSIEPQKVSNIVTRFLLLNWYLLELLSVRYNILEFADRPHLIPATCIYAACKWTKRLPWDASAVEGKQKEMTFKTMLCNEMCVKEEELKPIYAELTDLLRSDYPDRSGLFDRYNEKKKGNISLKIKEFVPKLDKHDC